MYSPCQTYTRRITRATARAWRASVVNVHDMLRQVRACRCTPTYVHNSYQQNVVKLWQMTMEDLWAFRTCPSRQTVGCTIKLQQLNNNKRSYCNNGQTNDTLYAPETWTVTGSDKKITSLWNVDIEKIGKDKLAWYRKFSEEQMKTGKYWNLFGKGNIDGLATFWDTMDFCTKLSYAEWEVIEQEGGE